MVRTLAAEKKQDFRGAFIPLPDGDERLDDARQASRRCPNVVMIGDPHCLSFRTLLRAARRRRWRA
ncbi:hypothetical protein [Streptomyces sp. CA-106110]|uniref:hypothetical protein n=1 Tax=Streptomyces sp. CA-106110 TaxID=3240044 RepID=UPI003D8A9903